MNSFFSSAPKNLDVPVLYRHFVRTKLQHLYKLFADSVSSVGRDENLDTVVEKLRTAVAKAKKSIFWNKYPSATASVERMLVSYSRSKFPLFVESLLDCVFNVDQLINLRVFSNPVPRNTATMSTQPRSSGTAHLGYVAPYIVVHPNPLSSSITYHHRNLPPTRPQPLVSQIRMPQDTKTITKEVLNSLIHEFLRQKIEDREKIDFLKRLFFIISIDILKIFFRLNYFRHRELLSEEEKTVTEFYEENEYEAAFLTKYYFDAQIRDNGGTCTPDGLSMIHNYNACDALFRFARIIVPKEESSSSDFQVLLNQCIDCFDAKLIQKLKSFDFENKTCNDILKTFFRDELSEATVVRCFQVNNSIASTPKRQMLENLFQKKNIDELFIRVL